MRWFVATMLGAGQAGAGWCSGGVHAAESLPPQDIPPLARSAVPAPRGAVNHGPRLVELPSGALLVCWYSASSEAGADARILCSRSADRGLSWSPPDLAVGPGDQAAGAREANKSVGNVALYADASGRPWMIHGVIQRWHVPILGNLCLNWLCARVDVRVSRDGGRSWSKAARLDDRIGALPRAGVLRHPELGHLLPLYLEGEQASHVRQVEFASDGLWVGPPLPIPTRGMIQPSLVLQRDGRVRAFLRDARAAAVHTAVLDPASRRWSGAVATDLPNPGSAVEAFADDDGRFVLIHNPSARDRRALALASSRDGTHFARGCDLVPPGLQGDVAYPVAIRSADGRSWHVAYSARGKTQIHHIRFGRDWLRDCLGQRAPGRRTDAQSKGSEAAATVASER
jgi:predicted neuraminidase